MNFSLDTSDEKERMLRIILLIAIHQKAVVGAVISFETGSRQHSHSLCLSSTEVVFRSVKPFESALSRYARRESRFKCPSEITCLSELFYFMNTVDMSRFSAQILTFLPSFVILISMLSFKYIF
ncbi:unnamed protein product [Dracunculus medinensis]|uniref:Uncharacterized protein n=1 Tax=Dracunculus medinensis TaxID=318479 RepID=A0A0N4U243_DRAME|nr:unnamed protein product [Dracunculus medinensis]